MAVAIRVSYPEKRQDSFGDRLKPFTSFGRVEVAFYSPEFFIRSLNIDDVVQAIAKLTFAVSGVHLPHVNLNKKYELLAVLGKTLQLAKHLKTNNLIIHPSKGDPPSLRKFMGESITPLLDEYNCYLCWETFESKKRLFGGMEGLFAFCQGQKRHKICFDFSHVHLEQAELMKFLNTHSGDIRVFHISNRISKEKRAIQHLPIWKPTVKRSVLDLDFRVIAEWIKKNKKEAELVLEYLFEYHRFLLKDAQKIRDILNAA